MIAVIGDIVKSKSIENRGEVQVQLKNVLDKVNRDYADALASKFTLTLGDEFQGVFQGGGKVLRLIDEIIFSLKPVELRFGIGIGSLKTALDPNASLGADGPAYWNARKAIELAHKNNDYGRANIELCAESEHDLADLVNQILKLTAFQASGWGEKQIEVYRLILKEGIDSPAQINNQELAKLLGIQPSSLTRRFESSGIRRYMVARQMAETAMERINQDAE